MFIMSVLVTQATHDLIWHRINWTRCHNTVRSLQRRIVKAIREGNHRKVKRLSYVLTHSFAATVLAIRRVTENRGKKTAGIDGQRWNTPKKKVEAIQSVSNWRGYRPYPLKRIYIPKKNGKKRPLGIPAMVDRAKQALYLQALEPIAETTAEYNSYGFRPKRQCADAIEQCFLLLARKGSAQWILEGDIKGFFDNIAFEWINKNIPINQVVMKKWLNSGYVDKGVYFPTRAGVPQGGIISPAIANMVLDGLEEVVKDDKHFQQTYRINYVRYADDFVVTGNDKRILEQVVKPRIVEFLKQRGVELSEEKTKITHISEGFDFLGQNVRKYQSTHKNKLRITPSKDSIQRIQAKIKDICKSSLHLSPTELIKRLNPVLRGWANYHRHTICNIAFPQIDHYVYRRLMRWAKRRHPTKTGCWIKKKYFCIHQGWDWTFYDKKTGQRLIHIPQAIKPQKHVKIRADANPYDEQWAEYFKTRDKNTKLKRMYGLRFKVYHKQLGVCTCCKQPLNMKQVIELHHKDGDNRNNKVDNLVLLHLNCHRQVHHSGLDFQL